MEALLAAGWTFPADVDGWLHEDEGLALAKLGAGKRVLEIGSYQGRSAICLAQVASEVVSVDHHQGDSHVGDIDTLEAFKRNLDRYGLAGRVRVHVEAFTSFAPRQSPGTFDLVFVDAGHDEASAAHDAAEALRLVRPGGVVAFHDWTWPSVKAGAAKGNPLFAGRPEGQAKTLAWFVAPQRKRTAGVIGVELCIPSRDGRFDDEVLMAAHAACHYALRAGIGCNLARAKDSYSAAACRNRGVAGFLSRPQFGRLLFVDDDVTLPASAIVVLSEIADRYPDDVICGCVPSIREKDGETSSYVQVRPIFGDWLADWPDGLMETQACGGGCMMIPQTALDAVGFPWFRWPEEYTKDGIKATSDDGDFCNRVRALGRKVWATGAVRCGHRKSVNVADLIGKV